MRRSGKQSPLDFALSMMRSKAKDVTAEDRKWACATAIRFCHPTLNSVDHGVKNETLDLLTEKLTSAMKRGKGVRGLLGEG